MKKIICIISTVVIIFSAFTVLAAEPSETQKTELFNLGIMTGDTDGNLRLSDAITRAEAVKMICTAGSIDINNVSAKSFPDVDSSHWAYKYIQAAKENDIINGDENGNFNPEDNITNEEIVKMTVSLLGYDIMAETTGGYPAGYTAAAARIGLTDGVLLEPGSAAVRGDVGIILCNALDIPIMAPNSDGYSYVIMDGNGVPLLTLRSKLENE